MSSGILRNRVKSSYESKRLYSSNFILDRIIKQKLNELEKVINIRAKTVMKAEEKNDVNINIYSCIINYRINSIYFKKLASPNTVSVEMVKV